MNNYLNAQYGDEFYKVAYYKQEELAREEAIEPITLEGKFNFRELNSFSHKIIEEKKLKYSIENPLELLVRYEKVI